MSQATTGAREDHPVVGDSTSPFQRAVDSNASAENRCSGFRADALGDGGDDVDPGLNVLLESTVRRIPAEFDVVAIYSRRLVIYDSQRREKAHSAQDPSCTAHNSSTNTPPT